MRLLSLPSTLANLRPLHLAPEQDRLRAQLRAQGATILPGDCPHCGGVTTREACQVTRPGQPTATKTVWRCYHHYHDGTTACPPRAIETLPGEETPTLPPTETNCPICGQATPDRATYCSRTCRQKAYTQRRATSSPPTPEAEAKAQTQTLPEPVAEVVSIMERILALPGRARAALRGLLELEGGQA